VVVVTKPTPTLHHTARPSELGNRALAGIVGSPIPAASPTLLLLSQTSRILGVFGVMFCVLATVAAFAMGGFTVFSGMTVLIIAVYTLTALSIARGLREQRKVAWWAALIACIAPLGFVNFAVFNESFLASLGLFGAFLLSLVRDEFE
jgi:lysylphosphatidylglycerol synthetase-like protein (DUF2156 family)